MKTRKNDIEEFHKTSNFIIVMPTLNEEEGLSWILPKIKQSIDVILVDDGSTDATLRIASGFSNVRIIKRSGKRGLVSAELYGMTIAIRKNVEYIVTMDADGQHDPTFIDEMVNFAIREHADLVIGSRYSKGGDARGFSFLRRLSSFGANLLYRLVFGWKVLDSTSGFRVYSRRAVEFLSQANLNYEGYVGQVEIVKKLLEKKFIVKEYPITFKARRGGKSKLSPKVYLETLNFMLFESDFLKYIIVGIGGLLVNEGVLAISLPFLGKIFSETLAIEVSIITNFMLNDKWTFKNRKLKHRGTTLKRFISYNVASLVGGVVNFTTYSLLTFLFYVNPLIANFVGILIAFTFNFSVSSSIIWHSE
ncbi:MAG: glycosyltransferase [Thermoproteota archaeon]